MDFGKVSSPEGIRFELPADSPQNFVQPFDNNFQIFSGCPIWSQKNWTGLVFPEKTAAKDYLFHYSRCFDSIELNSTFYHLPAEETQKKWLETVPENFHFCPKLPKTVSHGQELISNYQGLRETIGSFERFGDNYGIGFLQLPPQFEYRYVGQLKEFLNTWPQSLPLSIEFRHPTFFDCGNLRADVFDMLSSFRAGAVVLDVSGRRDLLHMSVTSDTVMIRFLGNHFHATDFERINEWCVRIGAWLENGLRKLYFFAHQADDTNAPKTVEYFLQQMNNNLDLNLKPPNWAKEEIPDQVSFQI